MARKISPDCKRIVMLYADRSKLTYLQSMEFLIMEGFKSVSNDVENPVRKPCMKR